MVIWPVSPRSKMCSGAAHAFRGGGARCSAARARRGAAETRGSCVAAWRRSSGFFSIAPGCGLATAAAAGAGPDGAGAIRVRASRAEGLRAVFGAVGPACERRGAAEEKVEGRRIAERPAADPAVEVEKRAALRQRDVGTGIGIIDVRLGIGGPNGDRLPWQGKQEGPRGERDRPADRVLAVALSSLVPVHHKRGVPCARRPPGRTARSRE